MFVYDFEFFPLCSFITHVPNKLQLFALLTTDQFVSNTLNPMGNLEFPAVLASTVLESLDFVVAYFDSSSYPVWGRALVSYCYGCP